VARSVSSGPRKATSAKDSSSGKKPREKTSAKKESAKKTPGSPAKKTASSKAVAASSGKRASAGRKFKLHKSAGQKALPRTAASRSARTTAASRAAAARAAAPASAGHKTSSERAVTFVDPRDLAASGSVQESLAHEERTGTGVFAEDSKVLDVQDRLAEKAHANRSRLMRKVMAAVGIIAAVVVVVWILFFSPLCRVNAKNVTVTGTNQWVSEQKVKDLASYQINKSLLLVSSGDLTTSISQLPGVSDVSISKSFPNSLTIQVTPRVPKAIVKDKSSTMSVVDKDGVVIATVKKQLSGVPLIQVDDTDKELATRAVKQALSVLASVPTSLLSELTQVTAMTQDSVTTQTKDGHTIIWGNASQMKLKAVVVEDLLSNKKVLGSKKSIDVSAPKRPILK
jgi:cell division protein FtsQ